MNADRRGMDRTLLQREDAPRVDRGAFLVPRRRHARATWIVALVAAAAMGCASTSGGRSPSAGPAGAAVSGREEPFVVRPFRPFSGSRWIGNAIAYGPHRDGQRPDGASPTREQLRQDLALMTPRWSLLRVYGAAGPAESLLALIHEERLDMKVLLGVWIAVEERRDSAGTILERFPEVRAANRHEVETGIRLARTYPDIVLGLNVGNETQIFWSDHRTPPDILIDYIRQVRAGTTAPVTTCDDFNFWNKPESRAMAREVDFVMTNLHPLWNGLALADALDWTKQQLAELQRRHADRAVILGETGWATRKHAVGEQATLIKGQPGEEEQAIFFTSLTAWAEQERMPTFFFEAFDENWKGGSHPDEVEKHWGLFRADRSPKPAVGGSRTP